MSFNLSDWYWINNAVNPTTQVYSSASGAMVANNAAAYLAWLTAENVRLVRGEPVAFGVRINVDSAADNGSGKTRLTVSGTAPLQTGQVWNFGTNGNLSITVISATTLDLTGLNFSSYATITSFGGPAIVDTTAQLQTVLDEAAKRTYQDAYLSISSSTNVTLTNPLPSLIEVVAGANISLTLPAANVYNSIPLYHPFEIRSLSSSGAFTVTVKDAGGSTVIILNANNAARKAVKTSNLTAAGTYSFMRLEAVGVTGSAADLITGTLPVARLPAFTGGDVTASAGSVNLQIAASAVGTTEIADHAVTQVKLDLSGFSVQVFTAGGTYTAATNCTKVLVMCKGGGGSGGGCTVANASGGGGGEGSESWKLFNRATITGQTVTIGAGGTAISANTNSTGNAGNTTSVGSLITAPGGGGGISGTSTSQGGIGGSGGTNDWSIPGQDGQYGSLGAAGTSIASGGGRGGGTGVTAGKANSGGGGGGAFSTTNASGAGGSGIAVFYEF